EKHDLPSEAGTLEKSTASSPPPTCSIVTVANAGRAHQLLVSVLTRDNGIYEIQYNEKSGNTWKTWLRRKAEEGASAIFVALPGRSYAFRVRELTPSGKPSAWSEIREWGAPADLALGSQEKPPVVEAKNETPSLPEAAPIGTAQAEMLKNTVPKMTPSTKAAAMGAARLAEIQEDIVAQQPPVKLDVAGFSLKAGRISPARTRALPIAFLVRVKTRSPAGKVLKIASHGAAPSTAGLRRASLQVVMNRALFSLSHFARTEAPGKAKTLPRASRPPSSQAPSPSPAKAPEKPLGSLSSPRSDAWVELSVRPSDFKLSALPIRMGETVKISTLIRNSGNAAARQLVIEFLEDGKRFARGIIDAMPPAAVGELSARWTPSSPGRHVLTVLVEPPPDAQESDKLDNKASITVTVNRQE
ncbi:MAG: hypothetical protein HYU64_02570, partial [Armatimonadetes bacterium]|nr:hypothetical protein [Armatimonadota bacterium]